MSENVVFFRPVEKVGTVVDILRRCHHSNFPIVDTDDDGILYGTISVNVVCALLKHRSFGQPVVTETIGELSSSSERGGVLSNYIEVADGNKFVPIAGWEVVEGSYNPKHPSVNEIRITRSERELLLDLRPYANKAPITVQETASVEVSKKVFR